MSNVMEHQQTSLVLSCAWVGRKEVTIYQRVPYLAHLISEELADFKFPSQERGFDDV
jgi:hypothetical protein